MARDSNVLSAQIRLDDEIARVTISVGSEGALSVTFYRCVSCGHT